MPVSLSLKRVKKGRQPEEPTDPVMIGRMMDLVHIVTLAPRTKVKDIATALEVSRSTVSLWLQTDFVRSRVEASFDSRPALYNLVKNNALDSAIFLSMLKRKGIKEIVKDEPNPVIISNTTKASLTTLQGIGILKEHLEHSGQVHTVQDLAGLIGASNKLELALRARLEPDEGQE